MKKYTPYFIIIFLISLVITGQLINKKNSYSKKNEISNFAKQLKIRNEQIAKIQSNLLKDNKNINDLIKIAELTMQDKSFEKERFKKLGKYSVYIGAEGNFIIKEAYKALTKENLSIAIKFVNEGLGMKSSLKKELIN